MTIHAHDSFEPVTSLTLQHIRIFLLSDLKLGNFRKSDAVNRSRKLIRRYYQARGLDESGPVTERKLRELEIFKAPAVGEKSCQAMKHAPC